MTFFENNFLEATITRAVKSFPKFFDRRLLKGWYQILAHAESQLFEINMKNYARKIVFGQFFLIKEIEEALEKDPNKRHVFLKTFSPAFDRLSLLFVISHLQPQEQIDKQNILLCLHSFLPGIQGISYYFTWKHSRYPYDCYYLEYQVIRKKLSRSAIHSL
jgi:hypothetical protein